MENKIWNMRWAARKYLKKNNIHNTHTYTVSL